MPRIQEDFTTVSSTFEALKEGDYQVNIEDIEETESNDSKLPMFVFHLVVTDPRYPELEGYPLSDYCVTKTNKGQRNRAGLGRIKAYAEATLGVEAANSPDGYDTDEIKGNDVTVYVKQRAWEKKDGQDQVIDSGVGNKITKVLPVG